MARDVVYTPDAPGSGALWRVRVQPGDQGRRAGLRVRPGADRCLDRSDRSGTTIGEQTRQCLRNVQAILEAAGSDLSKVVSATFILEEPDDFAGMNEEWKRWFPTDPPARQGARHPLDVAGMLISIAVIAEA